jgi:dihydrofolate synthase / folylpolyglutamate synthase
VPSNRLRSARAYLASRARFGVKFGLDTIHALTEALDHPERQFTSLLVAGTNGKGSVVAYVDAALRAGSLRVGRYTSPHLVTLNERITVQGKDVTDDELAKAIARVRQVAEELVRAGRIRAHPTHFEVLTAAAFHHFRRAGVELAVLEVGLGGRLDATNVAEPLVSAIVSIDRDHESYLGSTLALIAGEKAGVLRAGRTAVLGPMADEARHSIDARALERGARLLDAYHGVRVEERGSGLEVTTGRRRYGGLQPLPGRHQRDNVVVAIRLLEEAAAAGVPVDLTRVSEGIAGTQWPGRLQWIPGPPPLLLDGAHNPAGARALADYLAGFPPVVLVFGAMADKHVAEMARVLFPLARAVVLAEPPMPRAAPVEEIARRAGLAAAGAVLESNPRRALARARRLANGSTPVVVAGSLYLVGEVLKIERSRRRRPHAAAELVSS